MPTCDLTFRAREMGSLVAETSPRQESCPYDLKVGTDPTCPCRPLERGIVPLLLAARNHSLATGIRVGGVLSGEHGRALQEDRSGGFLAQ